MPVKLVRTSLKVIACTAVTLGMASAGLMAQQAAAPGDAQSEKLTHEPVYRTTRTSDSTTVPASNASTSVPVKLAPIDQALQIANEGLQYIRRDIRDYTATMIKRERINGAVGDAEFMTVKIRNRKVDENIPLSIYMKFLKPTAVKDREVIWIEGQNDGKLIAHEGSGMITMTVRLDPEGFIAMRGNRYPIHEAGIENLVFRLIEKGERDKRVGDATVKFYENTKINGRQCTLIQVVHPEQRPEYEFHICRVFIDQELQVPIRYAAYGWPEEQGGKPTLEEEYTYLNLALNVGLSDQDFDHTNASYNFK